MIKQIFLVIGLMVGICQLDASQCAVVLDPSSTDVKVMLIKSVFGASSEKDFDTLTVEEVDEEYSAFLRPYLDGILLITTIEPLFKRRLTQEELESLTLLQIDRISLAEVFEELPHSPRSFSVIEFERKKRFLRVFVKSCNAMRSACASLKELISAR